MQNTLGKECSQNPQNSKSYVAGNPQNYNHENSDYEILEIC